jgi:hypothetical protein
MPHIHFTLPAKTAQQALAEFRFRCRHPKAAGWLHAVRYSEGRVEHWTTTERDCPGVKALLNKVGTLTHPVYGLLVGVDSTRISPLIEVDFHEIEERCAAFASSLSHPTPMKLPSRTNYIVHFDGASAQPPVNYVGTRVGKSDEGPGSYHIYDGERLVAELRFVSRIETSEIPPTHGDLMLHIQALEKAHAEAVEAHKAASDYRDARRVEEIGKLQTQLVGLHPERERFRASTIEVPKTLIKGIFSIASSASWGSRGRDLALIADLVRSYESTNCHK